MSGKPKEGCDIKGKVRSRSSSPATSIADSEASDDPDHAVADRKSKKAKIVTDLNEGEEESMVEWLETNPIIYNKKLRTYKDTAKKEKLWMEKAKEIGKSVPVLKTWYSSLRTRYGRLKKRSGDQATERDQWIVDRFEFLQPHIHEVRKRTTVSVKQNLSGNGIVENEDDNDNSGPLPVHTPFSVVSSTPSCRQNYISKEKEEALVAGLQERNQQMIALQQQVGLLDKIKASTDRERDAFVDWTRTVIQDLDHDIWRLCQQDISQIMYKYIGQNDKLKKQTATALSGSSSTSFAKW